MNPYYRCDYIECLQPSRIPFWNGARYYFCCYEHSICFNALLIGNFTREAHWKKYGRHAHMNCLGDLSLGALDPYPASRSLGKRAVQEPNSSRCIHNFGTTMVTSDGRFSAILCSVCGLRRGWPTEFGEPLGARDHLLSRGDEVL